MEKKGNSTAFVDNEHKRVKIYQGEKNTDPVAWIRDNKDLLQKDMVEFGGILLRNFPIESMTLFNQLLTVMHPNMLDYVYRSTPRKSLGGKIYTTTEFPAHKTIPQHNENSYADKWPENIIFFCVIPAEKGGRTPLTDSRKILRELDQKTVKKFEKLGVMYVRNYTPGIDLSWQEVFQTDQRKEVEAYCKEHKIECVWNSTGPELTTKQVCQATLLHPKTKEKVWFNQAHLFHISSLDENERTSLSSMLKPHEFPRNTFYGNGEEIEPEVLENIRNTYTKNLFSFPWQRCDVLWLDNILTTHGREPFEGPRKIAAAMA